MHKHFNKITRSQIIKIHIAKKDLKISNEDYRSMLSGYITAEGTEAGSCKDLNEDQAELLLETLRKLGWSDKPKFNNPFEIYRRNDSRFATPEQMNLAFYHWRENSREKTIESFKSFCYKLVKKDDISFWLKTDMKIIIAAVKNLK